MKKFLNKIAFLLGIGVLLIGPSALWASSLPISPSVYETYLSSQQATSDTTLSLASATLRDGTSLSGYACVTIDANTPVLEYECGTVSGTSIINLTRGIDPTTGTTTVTALKFPHRRGADVKITDYPVLTLIQRILSGLDVFPSALRYDSSVSSSTVGLNGSNLASVDYANSLTFSGAPNASETTKGISELSTNLEAASSTSSGSTGARLVLPASLATSSCATAQFGNVLVSSSTGKLGISCFDQSLNYAFTASTSFAATTTFSSGLVAPGIITSFTSGTTTAINQPVFIASSTGNILVSSSTPYLAFFDGFAKTVATNGNPVLVQTSGVVTGFSGLSAGSDYYLSSLGNISSATSTVSEFKVGKALTTTTLLIDRGYDQFVSTFAFTSSGQSESSTACSGTATIPYPTWKKLIVVGATDGTTSHVSGELTLYKNYKTSGVFAGGMSGTNNGLINFNASFAGSGFSFSGAVSIADTSLRCQGTVYIYR